MIETIPLPATEIERLKVEHNSYAQQLEELLAKPYISSEEQIEEIRLKKLKLAVKDRLFDLERMHASAA